MEELDFIENLQRSGVEHIAEEILGYLDYQCLRRAEMVSEGWQKVILDGKLWEKLFNKNITLLPKWRKIFNALKGMKHKGLTENQRSVGYHRKWCCLVESELGLLESNWSKARYLEEKVQVEDISWLPEFDVTFMTTRIEMNGDWIVHGLDLMRDTIAVTNRWFFQLEKTLHCKFRKDKESSISSVKLSDDFIVASFEEHADLCVWDAKTKDLQVVISDDEKDFLEGLYLFRNLILTCHLRLSDERRIFKLREIPKDVEDEITHLYKKTITPGDPCGIRNLAMDETYIVISLLICSATEADYFTRHFFRRRTHLVQIRKTISFEIVNTIQLLGEDEMFDYNKGLIVTGQQGKSKSMRLWNVTGQCVREIADQDLSDIRFISDKFIVTCDDWGKLKIWDLAALKNTNHESNSKLLLQTIPSPVHSSSRLRPSPYFTYIIVDELQIVTVFDFHINDWDASCFLYFKTFLGVPKVL